MPTMVSTIFTIVCLLTIQTTGLVLSSERCGLFKYYDPHVERCESCINLCQDMSLTGTEHQCRAECSDYLMAANCSYQQYYDDVVNNCAPCFELCLYPKLSGNSKDCTTKCRNYLKAQNCTEEQYFNEMDMSCHACSQLCSQRDEQGNTTPKCFSSCQTYVMKYPPVNMMGPEQGDSFSKTGTASSKPNTGLHPGVIITIIFGVLALVLVVVISIVRWIKRRMGRQASYHAAAVGDTSRNEAAQSTAMKHGVKESNPHASSAQCYSSSAREFPV